MKINSKGPRHSENGLMLLNRTALRFQWVWGKNLRCKMFNSQTQESLQIPNANLSNVLNLLRRRIMIFYILCIILLPYRLCFDIIIYYDLFYLNWPNPVWCFKEMCLKKIKTVVLSQSLCGTLLWQILSENTWHWLITMNWPSCTTCVYTRTSILKIVFVS